jgi:hypothetical protein
VYDHLLWAQDLSCGGLENHWALLGGLRKRHTQFEKLGDDGREILKEKRLILCVFVYVLLEGLVRY